MMEGPEEGEVGVAGLAGDTGRESWLIRESEKAGEW